MQKVKQFNISMAMVMAVILSACGREPVQLREPNAENHKSTYSKLDWLEFRLDRMNSLQSANSKYMVSFDAEKSKLAAGFGIENPQSLDLGVYGKVGSKTVFVAPTKVIPTYDRLYWVMVKVLSEKYGCFMKSKTANVHTVLVRCKDSRSIVFERDISGGFAKFSGRQFDQLGQEIFMKPRVVATKKTR